MALIHVPVFSICTAYVSIAEFKLRVVNTKVGAIWCTPCAFSSDVGSIDLMLLNLKRTK